MKRKQSDLNLEPWTHEEEFLNISGSNGIENSQNGLTTLQIRNSEDQKQNCEGIGEKQRKKYIVVSPANKACTKNFVRKNLEDVKSHPIIPANYASILSDDQTDFIPINPRSTVSSVSRRPSIRATCIGYYDQNPLPFQSPLRQRKNEYTSLNKEHFRPKTTNHFRQSINEKNERKKVYSNEGGKASEKTQSRMGIHHLQRVLKSKQRLRQKLKKKSEKKEEERNLYLHLTMQERTNQRKSSVQESDFTTVQPQIVEKIFPNKGLKLYSRAVRSRSSHKKYEKPFFAIIGGSLGPSNI